ncbi:hypothetical protein OJAV_G00015850 [Oryzias javanicus]|uniref:Uncharacterized protein n=1 Tax=Oryzias javanicus TaxID=123683 RepID=A0A437DJU6_ORYJA|nr:hypothetical protein OJAV_G00015850 [Oryzias javanicus]
MQTVPKRPLVWAERASGLVLVQSALAPSAQSRCFHLQSSLEPLRADLPMVAPLQDAAGGIGPLRCH